MDHNTKLLISVLSTFFVGLFLGIFIMMYLFVFVQHSRAFQPSRGYEQYNRIEQGTVQVQPLYRNETRNFGNTIPKIQTLPYNGESFKTENLPYNGETIRIVPLNVR